MLPGLNLAQSKWDITMTVQPFMLRDMCSVDLYLTPKFLVEYLKLRKGKLQ
jgi:hypothetical protein